LIVTGADDSKLRSLGVLPPASQTRTLVLSDVTTCKAPGTNDTVTYGHGLGTTPSNSPPWAGDVNADGLRDWFPGKFLGPSPRSLCEGALNASGIKTST